MYFGECPVEEKEKIIWCDCCECPFEPEGDEKRCRICREEDEIREMIKVHGYPCPRLGCD